MFFSSRKRRAGITGCGVVSPVGNSLPAFWQALLDGRRGCAPIRRFDTTGMSVTWAAEIADPIPEHRLSAAERERLGRVDQYALAATREAIAAAALDLAAIDPTRVGVLLGTTLGGMEIGERYLAQTAGPRGGFDARALLHHPYYDVANRLARTLGVRGPVLSPSIACASGTEAIGIALDFVRLDRGDLFIVGGAEALSPFVVNGFNCLRATTADVVRPFDARRSGLLLGEGSAVVIVEALEHARQRGVTVAVEVAGTGMAGDATHMTAPARDGSGAARAMRMALRDAGTDSAAVDFVSAHGTGTVFNDAMECAAIAAVLGDRAGSVPVNSIKGAIGHTLAAAGSFEAIMCVMAMRSGLVPATLNCEQLDPACSLDVVMGAPRPHPVRCALSTSSAFAGNNAAVVLRNLTPASIGNRNDATDERHAV
ncbi:beta-ketoacyl-[acyl-carrier-protein] synthase family protein [Candidatus Binatia bacterium]|nr:beta-ketoacyl-[acyl-carrier-protein] synthase family protein [Candidatus Binatia bacterium]